jgi:hypothetical protein
MVISGCAKQHAQYAAHGIQDHFEHCFWAKTSSDHVCHGLFGRQQVRRLELKKKPSPTFAAVIFDICALRPDWRSGAVSGEEK